MTVSNTSDASSEAGLLVEASCGGQCLTPRRRPPATGKERRHHRVKSGAWAYFFFRAARIWSLVSILLAARALLPAQESLSGTASDPLDAFMRQSAPELVDHYFDLPTIPVFITRRLIDLGDPRAIPGLRDAFEREAKPLNREFIAAALVRLSDPNPRYFNVVVRGTLDALSDEVPYRSNPASAGTTDQLGNHIEIQTWAKAHSVSMMQAIWRATIEDPGAIEALGLTEDQRSIPILFRALKSPNLLVVREAALALARMRQVSAIGPIIAACRLQNSEDRPWTARALLYFRPEKAQKAAIELIADPAQREQWRADIRRETAKRADLARLSTSLQLLDAAWVQLGDFKVAVRSRDPRRARDALTEYLHTILKCRKILAEIDPGALQDALWSAALDRSEEQISELKLLSREVTPSDEGIVQKARTQLDAVQHALLTHLNAQRP